MWNSNKKINKLDAMSLFVAFMRGPLKSPLLNYDGISFLIQSFPLLYVVFIFIGQSLIIKIISAIILYLAVKNVVFLMSFRYQFSEDGIRYSYGVISKLFHFIPHGKIEKTTYSIFKFEKKRERTTVCITQKNGRKLNFYSIKNSEIVNITNKIDEDRYLKKINFNIGFFNTLFSFRLNGVFLSVLLTSLFYMMLASFQIFDLKENIENEIKTERDKINKEYFSRKLNNILKSNLNVYVFDDYLSETDSAINKTINTELYLFRINGEMKKSNIRREEEISKKVNEYINKNKDVIVNDIIKINKIEPDDKDDILTLIINDKKLQGIIIASLENNYQDEKMIKSVINQLVKYWAVEKLGILGSIVIPEDHVFQEEQNAVKKMQNDVAMILMPYMSIVYNSILNLFAGAISIYSIIFIVTVLFINLFFSFFISKIYSFSMDNGKLILKSSILGSKIEEYDFTKTKSIVIMKSRLNNLYRMLVPSNGGQDKSGININYKQHKEILKNYAAYYHFNYNLVYLNIAKFIAYGIVTFLSLFGIFFFINKFLDFGVINYFTVVIVLFLLIYKPSYQMMVNRKRLSLSRKKVVCEENHGLLKITKIIPYSDISSYQMTTNSILKKLNLSVLRIVSNNRVGIKIVVLNKHKEKLMSILRRGSIKNDT